MKTEYRKAFQKDIKKIKDFSLLKRLKAQLLEIEEIVSNTPDTEIPIINGMTKLSGHANMYRIRLGDYRIGISIDIKINEKEGVFYFERFLHRKDIYRFFPKK